MFLIIRKILFVMAPEKAHYFTMNLLSFIAKLPFSNLFFGKINQTNSTEICGITFPNKVGLAAGFDKDARYLDVLSKIGFGHIEVGTVTPLAQDGNPQPRLFRLPQDRALINRMGFNNQGVDAMVERLKNRPKNLIVGGNIGKNKLTPNENAVDDYLICLEKLFPYVDYFTVNISSPNTPGLRALQDKEPLTALLSTLIAKRDVLSKANNRNRPVFLKIAPDLSKEQLHEIAEIVVLTKTDGVVVSNTTIDRNNLQTAATSIAQIGMGGLSGAPVKEKSDLALAILRKALPAAIPIIGVGGIMDKKDGMEKINLGASLVQVYTGFVYGGIGLIKKLNKI